MVIPFSKIEKDIAIAAAWFFLGAANAFALLILDFLVPSVPAVVIFVLIASTVPFLFALKILKQWYEKNNYIEIYDHNLKVHKQKNLIYIPDIENIIIKNSDDHWGFVVMRSIYFVLNSGEKSEVNPRCSVSNYKAMLEKICCDNPNIRINSNVNKALDTFYGQTMVKWYRYYKYYIYFFGIIIYLQGLFRYL